MLQFFVTYLQTRRFQMASIKNIDGLSIDDINQELNNGVKFVVFEYCFSIIVMTFKNGSDI